MEYICTPRYHHFAHPTQPRARYIRHLFKLKRQNYLTVIDIYTSIITRGASRHRSTEYRQFCSPSSSLTSPCRSVFHRRAHIMISLQSHACKAAVSGATRQPAVAASCPPAAPHPGLPRPRAHVRPLVFAPVPRVLRATRTPVVCRSASQAEVPSSSLPPRILNKGAKIPSLLIAIGVGLAINFLIPAPASVTPKVRVRLEHRPYYLAESLKSFASLLCPHQHHPEQNPLPPSEGVDGVGNFRLDDRRPGRRAASRRRVGLLQPDSCGRDEDTLLCHSFPGLQQPRHLAHRLFILLRGWVPEDGARRARSQPLRATLRGFNARTR